MIMVPQVLLERQAIKVLLESLAKLAPLELKDLKVTLAQ